MACIPFTLVLYHNSRRQQFTLTTIPEFSAEAAGALRVAAQLAALISQQQEAAVLDIHQLGHEGTVRIGIRVEAFAAVEHPHIVLMHILPHIAGKAVEDVV